MSNNTIFDTNITKLYKSAYKFRVPSPYVIVTLHGEDVVFENTYDMINNDIGKMTLKQLYLKYHDLNPNITPDLIVTLYCKYTEETKLKTVNKFYSYIDRINIVRKKDVSFSDKFKTTKDLKRACKNWEQQFEDYLKYDEEELKKILDSEKDLTDDVNTYARDNWDVDKVKDVISEKDLLPMSDVNITTKIISMDFKWRDIFVDVTDGIDVFDDMKATQYTPVIRYVSSTGDQYTKLLVKEPGYDSVDLLQTIPNTLENDKIYVSLWAGSIQHDVKKHVKNDDIYSPSVVVNENLSSFYSIVFDLTTSSIKLEVQTRNVGDKITEVKDILDRLTPSNDDIDYFNVVESRVKARFDIYDIQLDTLGFLNFVTLDPMAQRYVYIEESLRPFSYKKQFVIHIHNFFSEAGRHMKINDKTNSELKLSDNSISLILQPEKFTTDTEVDVYPRVFSSRHKTINMKKGSEMIRVVTSGGVEKSFLRPAVNIIRALLMSYFSQKYSDTFRKYASIFIKDMKEVDKYNKLYVNKFKPTENEEEKITITKRLSKLKEKIPELFVDGYATVCQSDAQPIIMTKQEAKEWAKGKVIHKGKEIDRQYLPFPPEKPKYYFGCADEKFRFPGIKKNTLANTDEFEYLPCCFSSNHMDPKSKSLYNQVYNEKQVSGKTVKDETRTKTSKIVIPEQTAFLPVGLSSILQYYRDDEDAGDYKMVRYGTIRSINSFLHCVCDALNHEDYTNLDYDEKEDLVESVRQDISEMEFLEPCFQELFDLSVEDIRMLLQDNNVFLDPDLFYRLVEEYFDVNIYTFSIRIDPTQKEDGTGGINVPRNKFFHSRPMNLDRNNILILRNWGSIADNLTHPQCELIIDYSQSEKDKIKVFDERMAGVCQDLLSSVSTTSTFVPNEIVTNLQIGQKAPKIFRHDSLYNDLNYVSMFGYDSKLISQYIDSAGKARAFSFKHKDGFKITYVVFPTQPQNIASKDGYYSVDVKVLPDLLKDKIATAVSKNVHGKYDGVWFEIWGIQEGFFVPIEKVNKLPREYRKLPVGSINPVSKVGKFTNTQTVVELTRILDIINSLLEWLFEIYRRESLADTKRDPINFVGEKIEGRPFAKRVLSFTRTEVKDVVQFYNTDDLPRKLPNFDTLDQALEYLSEVTPFFNQNKKFVAYNKIFAQKLMKRMIAYAENTSFTEPEIPLEIRKYYTTSEDFKSYTNNTIFVSQEDLDKWQTDRILHQERIFEIRTSVDLGLALSIEPRIYSGEDDRIWLIQNPPDGTFRSATFIAKVWFETRTNPGTDIPTIVNKAKYESDSETESEDQSDTESESFVHYVYIISGDGKLIPVEDNSNGSNIYISVVRYSENRYGAMLPLFESSKAKRPKIQPNRMPILPFNKAQSNLEVLDEINPAKVSTTVAGKGNSYTVKELQRYAKALNLPTSGSKKYLVKIIKEQLIKYRKWRE